MISIGLRFGQGFDKVVTHKVMQSIPVVHDYDLLIIGASPGGIALAMEARAAGKRTAIVRKRQYTPAEEHGFEEDMVQMATALAIEEEENSSHDYSSQEGSLSESVKSKRQRAEEKKSSATNPLRTTRSQTKNTRKVRPSRLDLNNELYKRGKECVRVMHHAATLGELIEKARHLGWRVCTPKLPLTLNWYKMTEDVMDYVMEKNYNLMNDLSAKDVKIIEGKARFLDNHTVAVANSGLETAVTADLICIAPSALYEFPKEIEGSAHHGISFDDFPRLYKPPGKTLVVGGTTEALECAGILACCQFPVTVVSETEFLQGFDREMTKIIMENLNKRGVKFMKGVTLRGIVKHKKSRPIAVFKPYEPSEDEIRQDEEQENKGKKSINVPEYEDFDTILFAIRKNVNLKSLGLNNTAVELDPKTGKIKTNQLEQTEAPNIYAIGDTVFNRPQNNEVSELAGKLLGQRLFHNKNLEMDYSSYPIVMYTPIEYAFVGITEDLALSRFGTDCINVHHGFFDSAESILFPTKEKCFAKIIVYKPSDTVIGMHILGPGAGEIIQGFAAAIKNSLTWQTLQTIVGVPGTSARQFLKLRQLRSYEKMPTSSELDLGVSLIHTN